MSFEAALIVSGVILIGAVVILGAVFATRRKAAREEELKRQASMRGWSLESTRESGCSVHRWKGVTDGVAWVAESRYRQGGHGHNSVSRSHWRATAARGPAAAILCMGVQPGREIPSIKLAQGDGMLANLAKKAAGFAFDKAVDAYFGDDIGQDVDARSLKQVPGTPVPGYVVMADDVEAASRLLFQGLTRTLTSEPPSADTSKGKRTWVLLWKNGIALGQASLIDSIEELDRMARLGASVSKLPIV